MQLVHLPGYPHSAHISSKGPAQHDGQLDVDDQSARTGRHLESREDERERRLPSGEQALMAGFQLRAPRIVGRLQTNNTMLSKS